MLHAKAVVADDELVLVTSANLTEAALDRNIELGLLVRDRALAATVSRHFQVLIDRELLRLTDGVRRGVDLMVDELAFMAPLNTITASVG